MNEEPCGTTRGARLDRSSDERLQSEKDLKLIEIPSIFPQETSPSVGFVLAWSKGGKDTSVRLIKHFANERENTWRKEAELIEELNAERGHPNILKYRWHCRTGECSFKIGRQSFPMLKESSFLLCYECTSSVTLTEYLQNSKIVLNLDALLAVAMDLICAIKYLEYNGVVHNNITTSSVLIGIGTRVPPITAVLGGFGSAQRISEDFPECSRNSHSMKNILGKNILQFGFVLSELIKNCREAEEFEELHEVMNLCFEQDADVRPNVSQLRDLLENLWYQNDVWDTTL